MCTWTGRLWGRPESPGRQEGRRCTRRQRVDWKSVAVSLISGTTVSVGGCATGTWAGSAQRCTNVGARNTLPGLEFSSAPSQLGDPEQSGPLCACQWCAEKCWTTGAPDAQHLPVFTVLILWPRLIPNHQCSVTAPHGAVCAVFLPDSYDRSA